MKLINSKPGETPDARIIRCANNLLKAVVAAGYSLHSTEGMSSVEVGAYNHRPGEISVFNILSKWNVDGRAAFEITFKQPDPPPEALVEDEYREGAK